MIDLRMNYRNLLNEFKADGFLENFLLFLGSFLKAPVIGLLKGGVLVWFRSSEFLSSGLRRLGVVDLALLFLEFGFSEKRILSVATWS